MNKNIAEMVQDQAWPPSPLSHALLTLLWWQQSHLFLLVDSFNRKIISWWPGKIALFWWPHFEHCLHYMMMINMHILIGVTQKFHLQFHIIIQNFIILSLPQNVFTRKHSRHWWMTVNNPHYKVIAFLNTITYFLCWNLYNFQTWKRKAITNVCG